MAGERSVEAEVDGRTLRAERSREATTARILEAARSALRNGTLLDVTILSIAKELGLSRPTIYRYFPKVEDLLRALSDEIIHEIYDNLPDLPMTDPQFLDDYVSLSIDVFLKDPGVTRNLVLASAIGRASGTWYQVDPEGILRQVMEQRQRELRPGSEDPADAARMIVTYFRGALYGWAAGFLTDDEFKVEVRRAIHMTQLDT
ncbi:MAG: TetR/AcrR family transcriptional regulator [Acidimicrobiales bacterium]